MKVKKTAVLLLTVFLLISGGCGNKEAMYEITAQEGKGIYPAVKEKERVINVFTDYMNHLEKLPVSFTYGDKTYYGFGSGFKKVSHKTIKEEKKVTHVIELHLERTIKITVEAAIYPDYCAYEWTVFFENTGKKNSKVIKDVNAADMAFEGENPILKGIYGDGGTGEGPYSPYTFNLETEKLVAFSPVTGRSTYNHFPYFNLEYGDGGTFIAIGWPIMWSAEFSAENNKVHFTGKQKNLETYLAPGEKIRTPLMSFLAYTGRDEYRNMNLWCHWFIDCNMRKIDGGLFEPAISGGTSWLYNEMANATDDNQIAAMKTYVENHIPISYWWMDAGWYFKTGNESLTTWLDTGTWRVDTKRFPSGFSAISEYGESVGVKTLLWFEPEVVRLDWSLHDDENGIPREYMLNDVLVNFGNEDFVKWFADRASSIIDKGGISLYRQDYGINPESAFTGSNTENRIGIVENLYAQGYLKYWDMLIERYPNMMIDSCAAGGGRNDLESMRRAIPLHKTDHDYSNFTDKQAMHQTLFSWFPYFGTPVTGPDKCNVADAYALQSAYVPWVAMGYNVNNKRLDWATVKKCSEEWMKIKDYFYDDYYPLTEWSNQDTDLRGWEFINPEKGEGYFQIFRPEQCGIAHEDIKLYGLEDEAVYLLTDTEGNEIIQEKGRVLKEGGVKIEMPEKRSSIVVLIQKVG